MTRRLTDEEAQRDKFKTHYSSGEGKPLETWYEDKQTGGVERFGFGFDQQSPLGGRTSAYVTYQYDHKDSLLTVVANAGRHYNMDAEASLSVWIADFAQALDYARRFDAALTETVGEAVPRSLNKAGLDLPRWALDPARRGKDLTGMIMGKDIAELLKGTDQAVRRSYPSAPEENLMEAAGRAGLKPVEYLKTEDAFHFRGGSGAVALQSRGSSGWAVISGEKDADDLPIEVATAKTIGGAICLSVSRNPDFFSGMTQDGKDVQFGTFLAAERATLAAQAAGADPDHQPYLKALQTLGLSPAGQELGRKLNGSLTRESPVTVLHAPGGKAKAEPAQARLKFGAPA